MKKKIIYIAIALTIIIPIFSFGINKYFKIKEHLRYEQILADFEEALIWELETTGLSKTGCEPNVTKNSTTTSRHLIEQGYLKKEKLLDTDGKSYCKANAKIFMTEDCGVDYKIYLKCKNHKTKGYIDWQ